jgi:hypothetical protein
MRANRLFLLLVLLAMLLLMGNLPSPHYACAGKAEGDPCTYGYGCNTGGVCRLNQECTDDPSTPENECLLCRTG